ncbi:MAG: DGQHR domain-containing protein [Chloroflexota bacterium]
MKLPAFEIEQNGKKFYAGYMLAQQLCDEKKVKADAWSPGNREGYQRRLDVVRARLFTKYVANPDNISPPAVLLSVRESVEFTSKDGKYGILSIPDSSILYEVDGQHRIEGLREAIRRDQIDSNFALPVIIICPVKLGEKEAKNPRFCEAKQFVVINRTQKTVRSDLSDRFIARLAPEQREELEVLGAVETLERTQAAVQIADKLTNKARSPWEGRIKLPGKRGGGVSQRAFTNSLEPVLKDPILKTLEYDELIDALDQYWIAWRNLCPKAFEEPQQHVIQKTTGLSVLHELFIEAAKLLKSRHKDWTQDNFREVLDKMTRGVSDEFWHSRGEAARGGSSKAALRSLSGKLRANFLACNWKF